MLTIRLQRTGKKNRPNYRLVLAEKQRAVKKQVIEILGNYDPHSKELTLKDKNRLDHWISQHVLVSPTVNNLLVEKGIIQGQKTQAWKPKKKEVKEESKPEGEKASAEGASTETAPATEEAPKDKEAKEADDVKTDEKPAEEAKPEEADDKAKPAPETKNESQPEEGKAEAEKK